MSEWTPGSNQQEDETVSDVSERRPIPFPLARLEQVPAGAGPEAGSPAERPPVVLFDRSLIETQVSAPPFVAERTGKARPVGAFGHHARRPRPVAPTSNVEKAVAEDPQATAEITPEQVRKERSSWLEIDIVNGHAVDKEYGRAYQEEIRQERTGSQQYTDDPTKSGGVSDDSSDQTDVLPPKIRATLGGFATSGAGLPPQPPVANEPTTPQPPQPQHILPDGHEHQPDLQHRLSGPQKQVVSNIATVWFWIVLGIIGVALLTITLI